MPRCPRPVPNPPKRRPPQRDTHVSTTQAWTSDFGGLFRFRQGHFCLFYGVSEPSLAARDLTSNTWVVLTRDVHGLGKGFEHAFHHVMWLDAVEQFQVKIAPGFIGKSLEKLPRQ